MPTAIIDSSPEHLEPRVRAFYLRAMEILDGLDVRYMVGGAYSLAYHAGIVRHTKDLDLFLKREDYAHIADAMRRSGYRVELVFPHWLGKVFHDDAFVDVIFSSGNGLCTVDDEWVDHAVRGEALGRAALLCPAEEVIWTKAFVQERERFDGADIAHVLLKRGADLDWPRLLRRFEGHERVLLSHLLLFNYIYPSQRGCIPKWVLSKLLNLIDAEPLEKLSVCRGTLLSRQQYLIDIRERGFLDARVPPIGELRDDDISRWTAAIETDV